MRRRNLTIAAAFTIALAATLTGAVAANVPGERLAGPDRDATAIAISQHAFPDGAREVYIANREVGPDALVGGALTQGPILLVPQCGDLPDVVGDEIARLAPLRVYALGGDVVVCDGMLAQAAAAAPDRPGPGPGAESVTVSRDGDGSSGTFELAGGSYRVTYDYTGKCFYGADLEPVGEHGAWEDLPSGSGPVAGDAFVHNVAPGLYYVETVTGPSPECPWTVTLTSA